MNLFRHAPATPPSAFVARTESHPPLRPPRYRMDHFAGSVARRHAPCKYVPSATTRSRSFVPNCAISAASNPVSTSPGASLGQPGIPRGIDEKLTARATPTRCGILLVQHTHSTSVQRSRRIQLDPSALPLSSCPPIAPSLPDVALQLGAGSSFAPAFVLARKTFSPSASNTRAPPRSTQRAARIPCVSPCVPSPGPSASTVFRASNSRQIVRCGSLPRIVPIRTRRQCLRHIFRMCRATIGCTGRGCRHRYQSRACAQRRLARHHCRA